MNNNISNGEKNNLDLLADSYIELLCCYSELIGLDNNGKISSVRYKEVVLIIKSLHDMEQWIYESLDKNKIDVYMDYLEQVLDKNSCNTLYINDKVDLCLLRMDNYFYNTIKLKRNDNKIDIKANKLELESVVGSLIDFNVIGICICELFKIGDVKATERAYFNIFENFFVEYVLLESGFNFEVLSQINYLYYTKMMRIGNFFVQDCLMGFRSNFESYVNNIKEKDIEEEIVPMLMAYFIIYEITDDEKLIKFIDNVYIPDDDEVLGYIIEAFDKCRSSLSDYKKVLLRNKG